MASNEWKSFLILLTTLFSLITVSQAVKCYQCVGDTSKPDGAVVDGSIYTKDCLDPFNSNSLNVKECSDATEKGMPQECMKLFMRYSDTDYVVRRCIKAGQCVNDHRLTDLGTHIATCCKDELCNHAVYTTSVKLSTITVFTTIAIFIGR